jgi:hypothetical protein
MKARKLGGLPVAPRRGQPSAAGLRLSGGSRLLRGGTCSSAASRDAGLA